MHQRHRRANFPRTKNAPRLCKHCTLFGVIFSSQLVNVCNLVGDDADSKENWTAISDDNDDEINHVRLHKLFELAIFGRKLYNALWSFYKHMI